MSGRARLAGAVAAAALTVAVDRAEAGCGFDLVVANDRAEAVVIDQVSTAAYLAPKVYRKQWTGPVTLQPGQTRKLSFTVDTCPSSKVRYTRVHYHVGTRTYADEERHASGETHRLE